MITTRKKQSFGIAAVELGAPVSAVPSIPVNLNEWEHAVLMDTFYSAGGRETVSSTNLRMMWDQKNLYLYLICYEKEARVSRPSDENVLKTEWMLRKDKIETINEQISNFAQTYPTNLKASSNEALLFMRRYRFANCSCFSCCFKDAYPSSNVQ